MSLHFLIGYVELPFEVRRKCEVVLEKAHVPKEGSAFMAVRGRHLSQVETSVSM